MLLNPKYPHTTGGSKRAQTGFATIDTQYGVGGFDFENRQNRSMTTMNFNTNGAAQPPRRDIFSAEGAQPTNGLNGGPSASGNNRPMTQAVTRTGVYGQAVNPNLFAQSVGSYNSVPSNPLDQQ